MRGVLLLALLPLLHCDRLAPAPAPAAQPAEAKVVKSEEEWRKLLTPAQFHILREHGTEPAFSGAYWDKHDRAVYVCAACGKRLFSSEQKFDSGTGWPSFWAPIAPGAVAPSEDTSYGMVRTEVHCPRCGGHLGHVFDDGPPPTGKRYCINSAAIAAVAP